MSLRNRLAAIFSPTRRLADDGRSLVRAGGTLGGLQWVVPRAECQYRNIRLPDLPPRKREAAARIAAMRFDPQPGALHHVAWTGDVAHVWTWAEPPAEAAGGETSWIPETLLRAPPGSDGLRLLRQVSGVEGQCWRNGMLHASQWWPDVPSEAAWQRFARASGVGSGGPAPQAETIQWGEPWGDNGRSWQGSPVVFERWAWIAVAAGVLLVLGWQLSATFAWTDARGDLDDRMEALRAEATPLLVAREAAERARASIVALRELRSGVDDYRLMAEVVGPLPADTRLVEWRREGANLAAIVRSAESDPRLFVTAYANHPLLSGVVATPLDDGGMGLTFVLPETGPAGSPAGRP